MSELVEFGFGAIKGCQEAIGIPCEKCKYFDVCRGDEDGTR